MALAQVLTVAQLAVLEPVDRGCGDGALCVANTHLFFHPRAAHVRSVHAAAIMHEAHALAEAHRGPKV